MIFYSLLALFLLDPSVGGRGGEGGVEEALSSREGGCYWRSGRGLSQCESRETGYPQPHCSLPSFLRSFLLLCDVHFTSWVGLVGQKQFATG